MNKGIWIAAVALGAIATAADADGAAIGWNASMGAGLSSPLSASGQDASWPENSLSSRAELGLSFGRGLHLGAEAGYDRLGSFGSTLVAPLSSGSLPTETLSALHAAGVVRFERRRGAIRPFIAGGAGWYTLRDQTKNIAIPFERMFAPLDRTRVETGPGYNLGAGLELGNSRWAPRLDARWHSAHTGEMSADWLSVTAGLAWR